MASRLTIAAPGTITVLAGNAADSSLFNIPPGISITDPNAGDVITVNITAANETAILSASAAAGSAVTGGANALTISGTQAQVNAALATLEDDETGTALTDNLLITASDPAALYGQTDIAVNIYPTISPAFVAPPAHLTITPDALDAIPLALGDPQGTGLAAIGLGHSQTLTLTLSASAGVLLAQENPLAGIEVSGEASNALLLTFTPDALPALQSLLGSLEFAGPAGLADLVYVARDITGPLPTTFTYGTIQLDVSGLPGTMPTLAGDGETVLLGTPSIAGTGMFTGATGVLGPLTGGAVMIGPDASLNVPVNALSLTGSSLDLGQLTAASLALNGALIAANGATLQGPLLLGPAAAVDFTGTLLAGNTSANAFLLAISLAAGSDIAGSGTLAAGNFSESGVISGPGTITALGGETLVLSAGSITGGADLQVDAGGVMVLGPVSPLYGVFNATPISIDSSVTLAFNNNGVPGAVTGIYAGSLAQPGGAFVLSGPQDFAGTVTGFIPGDQIIFPGLTGANIANNANGTFVLQGFNGSGTQQSTTLAVAIPTGDSLFLATDNEGDAELLVRPPAAYLTLPNGELDATANIAQPILGLQVGILQTTTNSLSLTVSAAHGIMSAHGLAAAPKITLTAASLTALDSLLAGLTYTGTGQADNITVTGSGVLASINSSIFIGAAAPGAVAPGSGLQGAESQVEEFFVNDGVSTLTEPLTAGEAWIASPLDIPTTMLSNGVSGTALLVDGSGTAVFDGSAVGIFGAAVVVGDAAGAGTLAVLTNSFTTSGNLTIGAAAAAAGSAADILGALTAAGALTIANGAALNLQGSLSVADAVLYPTGTLLAYGTATAALGNFTDIGAVSLLNAARITGNGLVLGGALSLGGTSELLLSGAADVLNGTLSIGQDALLQAANLTASAGTLLVAGTLNLLTGADVLAATSLSGGTLIAPALTLAGPLTGNGLIIAPGGIAGGTLIASGGLLSVDGPIAPGTTLEFANSGTLNVAGALTAQNCSFNGTSADLIIDEPAALSGTIAAFYGSDVIDLRGVAPSLVTYENDLVTVLDSLQNTVAQLTLLTQPGQFSPQITTDGENGTLITVSGELPCFARGTRLLTPGGYRPVESLKPGDPLITAAGERAAIRWIGRRTVDLCHVNEAWPVVVTPIACGPGQPARAVKLSPTHCLYLDGVLVPVTHLVNGATIFRDKTPAAMTYYHVELARHDILLADGLAAESYLDEGNRTGLYHEQGIRSPARRACAKLITSGPKLARIRLRLHHIALAAGFRLSNIPHLRLAAAGRTTLPDISTNGPNLVARFTAPLSAGAVTLLSTTATPADTNPASEDRRDLGVCLLEAQAAGRPAGRATGWLPQAPGDFGTWMGTQANLLVPDSNSLTLTLCATIQHWQPPKRAGQGG